MTAVTNDLQHQKLRQSKLDRRLAMKLAATEYDRVADAIAALTPEDWTKPTDCPAWDVRQLACHVVGMATMMKNPLETNRQQKKAGAAVAAHGGEYLDALTGLQVSERADWSTQQVVEAARAIGPKAARGRKRAPFFIRRRPLPVPQHVNGADERWSLGYLIDTILTRDPWMHRVDLSVATGHPLVLTAEHDGAIVANVVEEWASRHGKPFDLTLTGPAGGQWTVGSGGEDITLDAIEFCRIVSGRGTAPAGLLTTQVPF